MNADEPLWISAIAEFAYCPRRCALKFMEGEDAENEFTLQGKEIHERSDEPITTWENGVRCERALALWSERYNLTGKADMVQFHPDGAVVPVEYKRGTRRPQRPDDLQLCAQALCLEEMLEVDILWGRIFYHQSRRCREVCFDAEIRQATVDVIQAIRELFASTVMPPVLNDARCPPCSLVGICQPELMHAAAHLAEDAYLLPPDEDTPP